MANAMPAPRQQSRSTAPLWLPVSFAQFGGDSGNSRQPDCADVPACSPPPAAASMVQPPSSEVGRCPRAAASQFFICVLEETTMLQRSPSYHRFRSPHAHAGSFRAALPLLAALAATWAAWPSRTAIVRASGHRPGLGGRGADGQLPDGEARARPSARWRAAFHGRAARQRRYPSRMSTMYCGSAMRAVECVRHDMLARWQRRCGGGRSAHEGMRPGALWLLPRRTGGYRIGRPTALSRPP